MKRLLITGVSGYLGSHLAGVAHSAGSLVALTAVEAAPPGSVDRLILLAPAVSSEYDLRPALGNVRQGIDVLRSYRDQWYLGVGAYLVGTTDRRWEAAAGRVGFEPARRDAFGRGEG